MIMILARISALALLLPILATPASAETIADVFGKSAPATSGKVDHSAWSGLLSKYVVESPDGINRVRYAEFKRSGHGALKSYIGALQAVDVATLSPPEQFAFWANLYNAKTIDIVLDAYPVKSIKDISLGGGLVAAFTGGPWKAKVVKIAGRDLSLDDIEHGILRPVFKDPRVHYAANCASLGCPNLMREAFTGANLDANLDAAARAFTGHPRGFSVKDGKLTASSIYDWYGKDFGSDAAGVLAHARKYADPASKRELESISAISAYQYNWNLNDAAR